MTIRYVHRRDDGTIASVHDEPQPGYAEEEIDTDAPDFPAWARPALGAPAVPATIPNWKAHTILKLDGKLDAVNAVIDAIPDERQRIVVREAFDRADPIPRDSPNLNALLKKVGYDDAGIDRLFIEGNALHA